MRGARRGVIASKPHPTVPAAAAAAGYNTLVFSDDFTSASTVTSNINLVQTAGVNWYPRDAASGTNNVLATTFASGVSNGNTSGGSNASSLGGILEVLGTTSFNGNNNLSTVSGPVQRANTTPATSAGQFKYCYIECYYQFNKTLASANGFPAFWSWQYDNANHTEIDFMETATINNAPQQGGGNSAFNVHDPGAGTFISAASGTLQAVVDSEFHTYGFLWKNTGASQGTVDAYFDNAHKLGPFTTGAGRTIPNFETTTNGSAIILGCGSGAPIYVDWVRVWQAP